MRSAGDAAKTLQEQLNDQDKKLAALEIFYEVESFEASSTEKEAAAEKAPEKKAVTADKIDARIRKLEAKQAASKKRRSPPDNASAEGLAPMQGNCRHA